MSASTAAVEKARADSSDRIYRVYADGVFDLLHVGHMKMIQQAKNALGKPDQTYVLIGVCSDKDVHQYKGKTVLDENTRVESVSFIKSVDEVIPKAPWQVTVEFLKEHKIDFVAHDAIPYESAGSEDVYHDIKEAGFFLETQRTEGISTSDVIVKLLRDYDTYVKRNLARGYSKKQLNVGPSWEVRAEAHVRKRKLDEAVTETKHQLKQVHAKASQNLRDFVRTYAFLDVPLEEERLETEIGTHAREVTRGIGQSFVYLLSFLNPLAYLGKIGTPGQCILAILIVFGLRWM